MKLKLWASRDYDFLKAFYFMLDSGFMVRGSVLCLSWGRDWGLVISIGRKVLKEEKP